MSDVVLQGEKIFLRPVRVTDAGDRYVGWMNDPEVNQYLESRFATHTRENIAAFIEKIVGDCDYSFFAICAKDTGEHIGNIKLGPINRTHHTGDIGLLVGEKAYWGRGVATEAIRLLTEYAFGTLGLHKVTASCYSNNPGSARAFEKLGFTREGLRKEQFLSNGRYVDAILLGKMRPQP